MNHENRFLGNYQHFWGNENQYVLFTPFELAYNKVWLKSIEKILKIGILFECDRNFVHTLLVNYSVSGLVIQKL